MKSCAACNQTRPLSEFGRNRARYDGRQVYCRVCTKRIQQRWYEQHRDEHSDKVKRRRAQVADEKAERIYEFLQDKCCVDCGETDPAVLEFDHVHGNKKYTIGECIARGHSWETIRKEIAKCEVRCANCHRRRTARELGFRRALLMRLGAGTQEE